MYSPGLAVAGTFNVSQIGWQDWAGTADGAAGLMWSKKLSLPASSSAWASLSDLALACNSGEPHVARKSRASAAVHLWLGSRPPLALLARYTISVTGWPTMYATEMAEEGIVSLPSAVFSSEGVALTALSCAIRADHDLAGELAVDGGHEAQRAGAARRWRTRWRRRGDACPPPRPARRQAGPSCDGTAPPRQRSSSFTTWAWNHAACQ